MTTEQPMGPDDIKVIHNRIHEQSVFVEQLLSEAGKVIVGQKYMLERLLIGFLTNGHVLLEGVPGLAKTLAVKTMASTINAQFQRIQFTPDLLPADLTGTMIYHAASGEFIPKKGPIFANIVLADEINRTPPKTQAALLEAMQEHKVTAGGQSYSLDEPFFVLATQNPIEQEGTYPLPEAQLDRFMFNLKIDYPSMQDEITIVRETTTASPEMLKPVISKEEITTFQDLLRRVPVTNNVVEYSVKLVGSTRPINESAPDFIKQWVDWGAGPRASQYLVLGAKAKAILEGRPTPDINDIQSVALPVLRHRVLPNFNAEADGLKVDDILIQLLEHLPE